MKTQLTRLLAGLALTFLPFLTLPVSAQSPTLGVTNDSALGLSLFWPVADAGFSLQWTPSLGTPVTWQPFPAAPSLSGDGNNLLVALSEFQAGNPLAFFELVSNAVIVPAAPLVVTMAAAPVNTTTAALNGTVQPNTFDTTYWFLWGTDISYGQTTLSSVVGGSNTAPVSVQLGITGLAAGTTYHFQLYGSNIDGISSGGDLTFTTAAPVPPPIIQTLAASNVTSTSAVLVGTIFSGYGQGVIHFQYGTNTSYTLLPHPAGTYFTSASGDTEPYNYTLTGLAPNTTYHYQAYGANCCTLGSGADVTFTTSAPFQQPPPTVTTGSASAVSPTSETISGTVNPNGALTTGLFIYNAAGGGTYTLSFSAGSDNSVHSFQTNLTGLAQNTTYFYTVVAYNSGGSSQGQTLSFTTGSTQLPPAVTVGPATSVTSSTATLNGTVNPNGAPTTYSFLYGTSPTSITTSLGTFSAGNNNSVHSFSPPLTGLSPNTTYYYIISANNSGGTSATAPVAFTTGSAQQLPYVLTLAAGGITSSSATMNAFVNPNGGDTHAYFLWGASTNYGHTNFYGDVGSSSLQQLVQSPVGGLAPDSPYHYRIVAYNSAGTNTGLDASFTTAGSPVGMALIPAGSFTMGDTLDGDADAVPVTVYVSAFYMDTNLVSYSQWQTVYNWAGNNVYYFDYTGSGRAANNPVQSVNWYDVVKWCNARSQQSGLTPVYYTDAGLTHVYTNLDIDAVYANWSANGFRLPTEAEWEKAARGGMNGLRFPWGNRVADATPLAGGEANYFSFGETISLGGYDFGPAGPNPAFNYGPDPWTSPVGYFAPNGYGLYDMAGNVSEWCWDWYGTPYAGGTDPHGPTASTSIRIRRGGSWADPADELRCAGREYLMPSSAYFNIGFRCVRAH